MHPDSPLPPWPVTTAERVPLGVAQVDAWLEGGLRRGGLHEFYAAQEEDGVSATGFALLLARLKGRGDGRRRLIWAREYRAPGQVYGPGLVELGIDPASVTMVLLPDSKAVLRAALDSVRSGAASAVLLEMRGKQASPDMIASRRFAVAAAETQTMILLVRDSTVPVPSAAHSRWRVASAPSSPREANAPGHPAFTLNLLRQRGGRDGLHIVLEWDRDTACFREQSDNAAGRPPLSGAVPALAIGGARDTQRDRAA